MNTGFSAAAHNTPANLVDAVAVAAGGAGPRLGIIANCASTSSLTKNGIEIKVLKAAARAQRFALQAVARGLLPGERVAVCYRMIVHRSGEEARVSVLYGQKDQKAHYYGLMVCGSLWSCPLCAAKITEKRRVKLAQLLASWQGSVFMVTFTLQHSREDGLKDLLKDLKTAWRQVKSGRWWQGFEGRYDIAGSLASTEVTVSTANGWHPHLHVLFFSRMSAGHIVAELVEAELSARFAAKLEKMGRYVSAQYGVKAARAVDSQSGKDAALKKYVSKWGLDSEMTKNPVKSAAENHDGVPHYSPFQLLALASDGKDWAGALFQEYALTMKGTRQLQPSKGFDQAVGAWKDQEDIELAEEQAEAVEIELAGITWSGWQLVLSHEMRAELLRVADSGSADQVRAFLVGLGLKEISPGLFTCFVSDITL